MAFTAKGTHCGVIGATKGATPNANNPPLPLNQPQSELPKPPSPSGSFTTGWALRCAIYATESGVSLERQLSRLKPFNWASAGRPMRWRGSPWLTGTIRSGNSSHFGRKQLTDAAG